MIGVPTSGQIVGVLVLAGLAAILVAGLVAGLVLWATWSRSSRRSAPPPAGGEDCFQSTDGERSGQGRLP